MSNIARVAGQAANTLSKPLNVEDVFSTYLYTGNGSTQTITNGIDLDGEGGLVWLRDRSATASHGLFDTERGTLKYLLSNTTGAEGTATGGPNSFNSNGFTLNGVDGWNWNYNGNDFASWTFRKAPKFFDVVTYTGDNSADRQIAHNLGQKPGMIIIKSTDLARDWQVYHRSLNTTSGEHLELNQTAAVQTTTNVFNSTEPTDTHFTVGANITVNGDTYGYVAYLFAHNDGDGEFGPDGDADIIKCGSYTGTGTANDLLETLDFEPQWMLVKRTDASSDWIVVDNMRGAVAGGDVYNIYANESDAEVEVGSVAPDAVGIRSGNVGGWGESNASGGNYIYIAIRRGPMAVPESATEVFDVAAYSGTGAGQSISTGFPVDATLVKCRDTASTSTEVWDRLRGTKPYLFTDSTAADGTAFTNPQWLTDDMDGFTWAAADGFSNQSGKTFVSWNFKRAPNFFDVVAYTGTGSTQTISHNLGVAPEMIWIKKRDSSLNGQWAVYHSGINGGVDPEDYALRLNETSAQENNSGYWNDTAPTDTAFTVNTLSRVNGSGNTFIAYLFASLDGVSKVGSVSHTNGTNTVVDCGFSAGARFVLLKGSDLATGWFVLDTARGIVAGDDAMLRIDTPDAEASVDYVDPNSTGFEIAGQWLSTGTYIFYAIA
jgi:hypothetical protein